MFAYAHACRTAAEHLADEKTPGSTGGTAVADLESPALCQGAATGRPYRQSEPSQQVVTVSATRQRADVTKEQASTIPADRHSLSAGRIVQEVRQRRRRALKAPILSRFALPPIRSRCAPENPLLTVTREMLMEPHQDHHQNTEIVQSTVQAGGRRPKDGRRLLDGRTWSECPEPVPDVVLV